MAATSGTIGNPFGVLRRALLKTAHDQLEVRRAVGKTVKELIAGQFAQGVDPEGKKQPARVDGKDAFMSTHLPRAIKVTPTEQGVQGVGELKENRSGNPRRQWLRAHQEGHEFPARASAGYRVARNAAGKRTTIAALRRATAKGAKRVTLGNREIYWREMKTRSRRLGSITNVRAHHVGKRVLQQRPIYPIAGMGRRWGGWVKVAVADTLKKQIVGNVEQG